VKKTSWLAASVVAVAAAVSFPTASSVLGARAAEHRASAASAAHSASYASGTGAGHGAAAPHWVDTWTSMPQLTETSNLPPAPFTGDSSVFVDSTIRQTVHLSVGGDTFRLHLSNAFGGADLPVTKVSVALPQGGQAGARAIVPGSAHAVTFDGHAAVTVPTGAQMVSDPVRFKVAPGSNLTVTMYLATGQQSLNVTSHPGSRTTTWMVGGDHVGDTDLAADAASVAHWYFLSGVEMWAPAADHATAILGDSITDGRGSTDNANNRWPDRLLARLQQNPATSGVAVLNQAAGGNRVLDDGLGPNGLSRVDRDLLAQSGVDSVIVFEGVNDIGTADATPAAQREVTDRLIGAFKQIILRAHAQGIPVYGATITPFGGNDPYDDPAGLREASRETVNHWIRTSGAFDAVIDFDRAVRDPQHPTRLRSDLDVGDHLHLTPAGYQIMGDAIPLSLFREGVRPNSFGNP
jgi:lysophospholipase L1-like esterase